MIRITDNGKVELDPIDITRDLALKTLIESEIKDEKTEKLLYLEQSSLSNFTRINRTYS